MEHLEDARTYALKAQDGSTIAEIHYDMGGVSERWGRFEDAEEHFKQAALHARKVGDNVALGKAIYGQGRIKASLLRVNEAVALKKEALGILERTGDLNMIAKVTMAIGTDLRVLQDYDQCQAMHQRAVELASGCGDVSTLGYALSSLAATNLVLGKLGPAEEQIHSATRIFQKLNDQLMIGTLHMYRGFMFHFRGDWEWAKEEFQRSLGIVRDLHMQSVLAPYLLEIGRTYAARGDRTDAEKLLHEAAEVAQAIRNQNIVEQAMGELEKL